MNRIGMIVDISHTSQETAADVLKHSKAPVIFSHSNAKSVWDVPRNIPDHNLAEVRRTGSLVMATFAPQFVSQSEIGLGEKATLERVAGELNTRSGLLSADENAMSDHIEYIASMTGREHVGLGSDFDGIQSTPIGLENVSKYPYLVSARTTKPERPPLTMSAFSLPNSSVAVGTIRKSWVLQAVSLKDL